MDRFCGLDQVGRTQRACRAADAVAQAGFVLAAHLLAGLLFRVDDGGCGLNQLVGQLGSRSAQRDLVGDLVEPADRLGALAVGAAHSTAAAAGVADHAAHGIRGSQHGQMQHDRGAQAGADVGRASGQVAQPLIIGERKRGFDQRSDTVCGLKAFLGAQARADDLQPQVVFFAHHDGYAAVLGDDQPAAVLGEFGRDQMLLDQLGGFGRAWDDLFLFKFRPDGRVVLQGSEHLVRDLLMLRIGQTEWVTLEVAREAHAAGSRKPGEPTVDLKHAHFCSPSILRISSRRRAACSYSSFSTAAFSCAFSSATGSALGCSGAAGAAPMWRVAPWIFCT